ncbi:hypothetical protein U1Q18_015839 [Sarracenia purpurea var. burkii]
MVVSRVIELSVGAGGLLRGLIRKWEWSFQLSSAMGEQGWETTSFLIDGKGCNKHHQELPSTDELAKVCLALILEPIAPNPHEGCSLSLQGN